jgi:undecaprenyl diphosphate synthase
MPLFRKKTKPDGPEGRPAVPPRGTVPRHIAVIMDGNGRWATKRGLPRTAGHSAGAETFRRISRYCRDIGVEYFTVYAFSTENWKRAAAEVEAIMTLFERYLLEALETMVRDRVRIAFFGDRSRLSPRLQELCRRVEETSRSFEGVQVNLCINYGGRDEILRAARAFAARCAAGEARPEDLAEAAFSDLLYSAGIPDPDLIIRPSGEQRISNFLLWQAAYAEFYYTDVLWPDFSTGELDRALEAFARRSRRYGGTK